MEVSPAKLQGNPAFVGKSGYKIPPMGGKIDLPLGNTERATLSDAEKTLLRRGLAEIELSNVVRYPKAGELESALGEHFGIGADKVLVTAGADEGIERACRAVLWGGRKLVMPIPTFEMIPQYARMTGAELCSVLWDGAFPWEELEKSLDDSVGLVTIVSPNNPTGQVVEPRKIITMAEKYPGILWLVDFAYVEFADNDPTKDFLGTPNIVVMRTFSKAWGLPGLRLGYALGGVEVIDWMRAASGPYSVSQVSLSLGKLWLREAKETTDAYIETIRNQRRQLQSCLREFNFKTPESQANFVLGYFENREFVQRGMEALGIGLRAFSNNERLDRALRISCPGRDDLMKRLDRSLRTVFSPEGILFDMDGVLVDVSGSYRQAMIQTGACFGVNISLEDIATIKAEGNANNDWDVTHRLILAKGTEVCFEEVRHKFEAFYHGTEEQPGLWRNETLMVEREWLVALKKRYSLAVVTGRPRLDAERTLEHFDLGSLLEISVCMEDAAPKPSPDPVLLALEKLSIKRAWMLGDTVDDLVAASEARVIPIGVVAPGENVALKQSLLFGAGAAAVLNHVAELEELWV
ncbi:MAG: TIGR01548 family HAD-type hydrolase [Myxococcota bacterium]|nr:TIGR01548 family HAD-type hydrolase [Myxococcota bacterium]